MVWTGTELGKNCPIVGSKESIAYMEMCWQSLKNRELGKRLYKGPVCSMCSNMLAISFCVAGHLEVSRISLEKASPTAKIDYTRKDF